MLLCPTFNIMFLNLTIFRYQVVILFFNCWILFHCRTSLVTQMVRNLPAMQETQVLSLDLDNPLEKGMATHSSILAWGIPWTEEPGGLYSPWGRKKSKNWAPNTHAHTHAHAHTHIPLYGSVCPVTCWQTFGLFQFAPIVNKTVMNVRIQTLFISIFFHVSWVDT